MKKIFALVIAGLMVLSFAACGDKEEETTTAAADETTTAASEETTIADETTEGTDASAGEASVADTFAEAFKTVAAKGGSAYDIASELGTTVTVPVMLMPMDMTEAEGLQGFNEGFKFEGYEEVAQLSPMIGTIPFMSFVFKLSADADVEAFADSVEEYANPAWNVCTSADDVVVVAEGSYVYLVMAPASFETEEPVVEDLV